MAHTATAKAPETTAVRSLPTNGPGVNFLRVLKSEWIKVTTVPSTVILLSITLVVMVGLSALFAWSMATSAASAESFTSSDPEIAAQLAATNYGELALTAPSAGIIFGQLLIASLAVVLIASEWGTGMIRSTMVAVPTRIPALLAKNLIIAVIAFVVGAGAAFISYFVAQPLLAPEGIDFAITTDGVLLSIINTGAVLALMAIIAMSIGTLLRNTAGGVVTAIGLLMVLPIIVQIFSGLADWIPDAARFLPSSAGEQMVALTIAEDALNQWQGALVLGGWALVLLVISLVVTKKRDV
ncbi:ABC transporter permease subunit [Arthrobacter sp. JZ12]|uniref:ABC transporter permease subunit n=1 Tax=Arthrobacter sp. JZ12 TaxID=2654190 RepID=UPI002B4A92C1|nr:ABC transporter permease subunit [Arthrobacter sp. JZ12]WRH26251.1 ABC transporter permease subunit [Arthrobacter sp. JZ12]